MPTLFATYFLKFQAEQVGKIKTINNRLANQEEKATLSLLKVDMLSYALKY